MNYQRILSYMYDYDRGVKRQNIGFVKVETRGDQCRVNIHMKLPETLSPGMLQAYFFIRRNDEILGIPFACAEPAGNEYGVRAVLSASFFEKCGFLPEDFSGVYICREQTKDLVFVSAWDDEPVYVETFRELRPAGKAPGEERGTERAEETEKTGEPEKQPETGESAETGRSPEAVEPAERIEAEKLSENAAKSLSENAAEVLSKNAAEELSKSATEEPPTMAPARSPWEELAKNFTKIRIAGEGCAVECLKIRPHHLALLPRRYWNESNSSFLLHGYYTYGHIILARREPGEEYFLGVPGKNRDRERVMAGYCGYTDYLPTGRKTPCCGYWCKNIEPEAVAGRNGSDNETEQ